MSESASVSLSPSATPSASESASPSPAGSVLMDQVPVMVIQGGVAGNVSMDQFVIQLIVEPIFSSGFWPVIFRMMEQQRGD